MHGASYGTPAPEEASRLVTTSENELKQLIIEYAHCLKIKKI
jgi:hypothetical protein